MRRDKLGITRHNYTMRNVNVILFMIVSSAIDTVPIINYYSTYFFIHLSLFFLHAYAYSSNNYTAVIGLISTPQYLAGTRNLQK